VELKAELPLTQEDVQKALVEAWDAGGHPEWVYADGLGWIHLKDSSPETLKKLMWWKACKKVERELAWS
jgi:hypothetical protein